MRWVGAPIHHVWTFYKHDITGEAQTTKGWSDHQSCTDCTVTRLFAMLKTQIIKFLKFWFTRYYTKLTASVWWTSACCSTAVMVSSCALTSVLSAEPAKLAGAVASDWRRSSALTFMPLVCSTKRWSMVKNKYNGQKPDLCTSVFPNMTNLNWLINRAQDGAFRKGVQQLYWASYPPNNK